MVFILVVLALLGAALAKTSLRQHLGSASELGAARAYQSAMAGLEWGSFQVLRNPAPPGAAPACFANTNITFAGTGLAGFTVTVNCTRTTATDGPITLDFYQLVATACNQPTGSACPNSSVSPDATYVERRLSRTVVR